MSSKSSQASQRTRIFFIGRRLDATFSMGRNSRKSAKELVIDSNSNICNIFASKDNAFYSDDEFNEIWAAGANYYGQCGIPMKSTGFSARYKPLSEYTPITHFKSSDIKIKQICVSPCDSCSFFISQTGKLYACGKNDVGQLGWNHEETIMTQSDGLPERKNDIYVDEPRLIDNLENVIWAQSAFYFSIALCQSNDHQTTSMIMKSWSRVYCIPIEIVDVIVVFSKSNKVFSTTGQAGPGSGHPEHQNTGSVWKEIDAFMNKNIIKFDTGAKHSLFLQDDGNVWACGSSNGTGCLGLKDENNRYRNAYVPELIEYFYENEIQIKDIACGGYHNLALDSEGCVYSWGMNDGGRCGDGTMDHVFVPTPIPCFKDKIVDIIKCGFFHSYVKTVDGDHYLFGFNQDSECIASTEQYVTVPCCINEKVRMQFMIREIISVHPGCYNTTIIGR